MGAAFILAKGRQILTAAFFGRLLLFREKNGPAWFNNLGTLGHELQLITDPVNRGNIFATDRIKGRYELTGNCFVNQLFTGPEACRPDPGGDDGMVIGHLFIIKDPLGERQFFQVKGSDLFRPKGFKLCHDSGNTRFHVITEIAGIGTGIGDQFFFVKVLGGGQGIGGREAM